MDARKPPYGCCIVLTAVTSKDLLTCTSTSVPSALRMCASYGALESTLVSSRSTVPDTLARAAARTFAATSPVSGCSVLPLTEWRPCGADDDDVDDDWAAFVAAFAATAPPPRAAATAAAVTSLDRMRDMGTSCWVRDAHRRRDR